MNTTVRDSQLIIKAVSKHFSIGPTTVKAVRNISLSIKQGELIAITGPSGSGKTTLSHILGGLTKPTKGEVIFKDEPLNYKNDRLLSQYRNKTVGFIFQNYQLIPHYTALENIIVPLMVANMSSSQRNALAKKHLRLLGLEQQQKQRASQLSGGQKQRVAIARALVTNPEIIIADEPTGNLDSKQGEEIMGMLEFLAHKKNITVIMVTHNAAMAGRADRIITLKDGEAKEIVHAGA